MIKKYNHLLKRYYNGCEYITKNPKEWDKYIGTLTQMTKDLEELIREIEKERKLTTIEILEGIKE